MNKKAGFNLILETLYWGFRIAFAVGIAFVMFLLITSHLNRDVNIQDTEGEVIFARVNSCLKRSNFDINKIEGCVDGKRYGINITKSNEEVVLGSYEAWIHLCKFKEFSCFNFVSFDDENNKIDIGVVVQDV